MAEGQTASSARRPLSTKIPAVITQTIFTPVSAFHQSLRSNQAESATPLLASTNTQTAALSPLAQLHTPPLITYQQMSQQSTATSELSADHLDC